MTSTEEDTTKMITKTNNDISDNSGNNNNEHQHHATDTEFRSSSVAIKKELLKQMGREPLLGEITNTGIAAALVGGFSLSTIQMENWDLDSGNNRLDIATYLTAFIATHICTCSCLLSACLYRIVNALPEDKCQVWNSKYGWLPKLAFGKFASGTFFYLLSVLLLSVRDLDNAGINWAKWASVVFGVITLSTVVLTYWVMESGRLMKV